jgi:hypothetical protein
MWGSFCHKEGQQIQDFCDSGQNPVLAMKAGRVSDFSGKLVGTISSTQLLIDPDIPAAHQLRDWFDGEGRIQFPSQFPGKVVLACELSYAKLSLQSKMKD